MLMVDHVLDISDAHGRSCPGYQLCSWQIMPWISVMFMADHVLDISYVHGRSCPGYQLWSWQISCS